MFTDYEKTLIAEMVNQINVKPTQPNAVEVVQALQSILAKVTPEKKEVEAEVVKE